MSQGLEGPPSAARTDVLDMGRRMQEAATWKRSITVRLLPDCPRVNIQIVFGFLEWRLVRSVNGGKATLHGLCKPQRPLISGQLHPTYNYPSDRAQYVQRVFAGTLTVELYVRPTWMCILHI
jgi:hypothetical protein